MEWANSSSSSIKNRVQGVRCTTTTRENEKKEEPREEVKGRETTFLNCTRFASPFACFFLFPFWPRSPAPLLLCVRVYTSIIASSALCLLYPPFPSTLNVLYTS